jgi:hypothetical protein
LQEGFDEGRFADAGLAADQDHVPLPLLRLRHPLLQLRQLSVSSNEQCRRSHARQRRPSLRPRTRKGRGCGFCRANTKEAIPLTSDSLDILRKSGLIL